MSSNSSSTSASGGAAPAGASATSAAASASTAAAPQGSSSSQPSASANATHFIAGVPVEIGQPVHVATKKQLQRQVNAIVGWNELDRAPMNIGSTLQRSNEPQIVEHSYFVCERSVGIRYLALLVQGRCYLISPNYDMREVALFSPVRPDRLQPGMDRSTVVPHQWTILDGLLVCDKDGAKSVLTLLLYDILALNGSPVMASKLQDRLKLIQNDVIGPRKTVAPPKGQPADPFQLVLQAMYPANRVSHVIRTIIPRVAQTRQSAGLVFTPVLMPYTPGYAKGLFQWSPTAQLHADFQLGVEWRGRPPKPGFKLIIHDKRTQVFHDWITFTPGLSMYECAGFDWHSTFLLTIAYMMSNGCRQTSLSSFGKTRKRRRALSSACTTPSGSRSCRRTTRRAGTWEVPSSTQRSVARAGAKVRVDGERSNGSQATDVRVQCYDRWLALCAPSPRQSDAVGAELLEHDRESDRRGHQARGV